MRAWSSETDLSPHWQLINVPVFCLFRSIQINLHVTGIVGAGSSSRNSKPEGNVAAIERTYDMGNLGIRPTKRVWKIERELIIGVGFVSRDSGPENSSDCSQLTANR